MFQANNKETRTKVIDITLLSSLLTLNISYLTPSFSVSIVDFEHAFAYQDDAHMKHEREIENNNKKMRML